MRWILSTLNEIAVMNKYDTENSIDQIARLHCYEYQIRAYLSTNGNAIKEMTE